MLLYRICSKLVGHWWGPWQQSRWPQWSVNGFQDVERVCKLCHCSEIRPGVVTTTTSNINYKLTLR